MGTSNAPTRASGGPSGRLDPSDPDHIVPLGRAPDDEQPLTLDLVVREGMNATQRALFACAVILIAITVIIVIVILAHEPWKDNKAKEVSA
jgi:hypothetical protein